MSNKDGRALARDNEVKVLRALHRFGWLRTRDVAALVWTRWASKAPQGAPTLAPLQPTPAGLRMAQRTFCRLRDARMVLHASAPDGSVLYGLSEAGARRLQALGVSASSGKDLVRSFSGSHYRHRCIANEIAISAIAQGMRAATEREVSQGLWLGGDAGVAGKLPDVLVRNGSEVWWVEVERSRKNAPDYARLLVWLGRVLRDAKRTDASQLLGDKLRWGKVAFICTAAFQAKLVRDLKNQGWNDSQVDFLLRFETCLYSFKDIIFG